MLKINLFILTSIITLLSSCGFHTPTKNTALNATIISEKSSVFATELQTRFNPNAVQNLSIQIGLETQKQQTASYTNANDASSYTLSLSVPVKVFDTNKKILFSQNLSSSIHLEKLSSTQADRLQIEESYIQLRNSVIKKLIRRLSRL